MTLKPGATWLFVCGVSIATLGYATARPSAARLPQAELAPADTLRPVLNRYCITCHNTRLKTAGLVLDGFDLARAGREAMLHRQDIVLGDQWKRGHDLLPV